MKHKLLLTSVLSLVLAGAAAHADTLYWSGDGTTPGGAGTWNTSGIHWGTSASGPFDRAWTNANLDAAVFEGTAATVTVGSALTVSNLVTSIGGYTFSSGSKITFSGTTNAGVTANHTSLTTTLSCIFGGSLLTKSGPGRLELNNSSQTVAKFLVKGGFLTIASANRLGTAPGSLVQDYLTLDGGGFAAAAASADLGPNRGVTIGAGGANFGAAGAADIIIVNAPIVGTNGGALKVTSGAPFYTPYDAGCTLQLNNPGNNYNGATTVTRGALTLGAAGVLPASTLLTLNGGDLNTGTFSNTVGKLVVSSSSSGISGSGTLTATNFDLRSSTTISAKLSGLGAPLTKTTTGTVDLTGANSYSGGTTISAGTLRVNSTTALGTANSPVALANGVTLSTTATTARTLTYAYAVNGDITLGQSATGTGALTLAGSVTLAGGTPTITIANTTDTISAVVTNGGLIKAGSGTLILTGANTYSGGTTVNEGTLQGTTTGLQGDIVNNAAVVFNQTTAGTYAGVISGPGTLTKNGSGAVTLSGVNTYGGDTTITAGSLLVNASLSSLNVIVNGGTLGGTGPIQGAVTVNSGGNIGAGSSAGLLTLANGLNMSAGGTNVWELASPRDDSTGVAGTDFDQLALTGGELNLSGNSTLLLTFTGTATAPFSTDPFWQANHTWTIVSLTPPAANTLNLPFASIANGSYNAGFFSNYVGTAGNIVLTFTTNAPSAPIITAQPQSRTNHQGTTATFTVAAFGTDPLSYQWYFPNLSSSIAGATNATLTKTNVQPTDAGNYLVVITNSLGSRTSLPALLKVAVPQPTTIQPLAGAGTTNVVVTWDTEAGWSYQLQYNTNLATTNWYVVSSVVGAGTPVTVTNFPPAGDPKRFYRVLTQ